MWTGKDAGQFLTDALMVKGKLWLLKRTLFLSLCQAEGCTVTQRM